MESNICNNGFSYSDIIAIIALVVSIISVLFNIGFTIYKNRRNLTCNKFYFWRHHPENDKLFQYCLTLILENKSELPISVVSIKLKVNNNILKNYPGKVFLYGGGYPTIHGKHEDIEIFTNTFPIELNPLSSKIIRAYFMVDKEINSNEIKHIILETTRNDVKFKKLSIIDRQY